MKIADEIIMLASTDRHVTCTCRYRCHLKTKVVGYSGVFPKPIFFYPLQLVVRTQIHFRGCIHYKWISTVSEVAQEATTTYIG